MMPYVRPSQVFQFLFLLYLSAAVVYTTHYLFTSRLCARLSLLINHKPELPRGLESQKQRDTQMYNIDPQFLQYSGGEMAWPSSDIALQHGLGHPNPIFVHEELSLSKAFAASMRPSKIIPYFFRASAKFDSDDITVTTLITSGRLNAFSRLIERYQGPISVTVHVSNTTAEIRSIVKSLRLLRSGSRNMARYVDVHLVIDSFDRQFNAWRNIARLFARTDLIMMLDVDFYLCTDFRKAIRKSQHLMEMLLAGNTAFVIPAFEYTKYADGLNPHSFPKDKRILLSLVKSKRIGMFHASWVPGHNSTDYKRYYAAPPGDVYKVTQYTPAYEPYVVLKKEGPPWCDERFIGYGGNKAACLFEMYISGIEFYVLADHFIIHQSHKYEEFARKNERKYNRKLYSEFKEEVCLRYLKMYHDTGLSNTTKGRNALQECKSQKRVMRLSTEMASLMDSAETTSL